jgi:hypothetical protein
VKLSEPGLAEIVGVLETTSVTLIGWDMAPVAAMVTVPWYVSAARPEVFTEMLTELDPDTVPPVGVTDSHDAPPPTVAVNARPDVPPILTGCAAGAVPPV